MVKPLAGCGLLLAPRGLAGRTLGALVCRHLRRPLYSFTGRCSSTAKQNKNKNKNVDGRFVWSVRFGSTVGYRNHSCLRVDATTE